MKLWDSYTSIEDYLSKCKENDYGFSITKVCPKKLENERNMNYQFCKAIIYQMTILRNCLIQQLTKLKKL